MKKIEIEKNYKKYVLWVTLIALFAAVFSVTYAWFSSVVIGDSNKQVVTTGTLELVYTDGPEIIANDIYPGDKITKTFTVENTGTLDTSYSINLTELTNEFINDELIYRLILKENTTEGIVPLEEGPIKEGISIASKELHEYTLEIEFIETGSEQNYNQDKNFSAILQINDSSSSNGIKLTLNLNGKRVSELPEDGYYELESYNCDNGGTVTYNVINKIVTTKSGSNDEYCVLNFVDSTNLLVDAIMRDNNARSDSFIDFSYTSNGCNTSSSCNDEKVVSETQVTNGLFYTEENTDEDGDGTNGRIYYFRGTVENNYVIFAGFCWRIVRTNENGSIKLRYGGEAIPNGETYTCPSTGTSVSIKTSTKFNDPFDLPKHTGYTFDTTTDSVVKGEIDNWYKDNIMTQDKNVISLIANTIYCNDRSGAISAYGSYTRLLTNKSPQFKCPNIESDGYSLSVTAGGIEGYGNNLLIYPVALLTADELAYAGMIWNHVNKTFYLYTAEHYWTMSPHDASNYAYMFIMRSNGSLSYSGVISSVDIVPVLSLVSDAKISGGSGTIGNPYIIDTTSAS